MSAFWSGTGEGSRAALVASLLALSVVLTAALTWQAFDAAASHRLAAQAVLRKYATLAADELVRRATNEVGYHGCYPLLSALQRWVGPALPATPEALGVPSRDGRDPAGLVRFFFSFDHETEAIRTAGERPAAAEVAWLEANRGGLLDRAGSADGPFRVAHATVAGRAATYVYAVRPRGETDRAAVAGEGAQSSAGISGLALDSGALGAWLRRAVDRAPLLPSAVAGGGGHDEVLHLRVRDPTGHEVLGAGAPPSSSLLAVRVPFGEDYQGLFDGFVVEASIDPGAAERLVIGGLPGSRVPILAALLLLNAGLVTTAALQLRRERALTQLRADFVSRVSHELRTPLTQIRMFTETLLLDRIRSADEARRSLQIIDREARRLGHLVENVLQFSRAERNTLHLAMRPREIAALVQETVEGFAPLLASRGVRLETRLVEGISAQVDDDAFRQILLNLLDNAAKYGGAGPEPRVVVGMSQGGGKVEVWVEDAGPGVPRRHRKRIWRRFERLDRDRRSAVAGTGIGLAVVRELAALHGGRAHVEDGRLVSGARFVVELPEAAP